jgi:hypothetical protein
MATRRMLPRRVVHLRRAARSGYTWALLAGGFFIGCGWLMERNGVQEFSFADKHGKAQGGSPELLYLLGGGIVALALVRALLFRMEEVKAYRAQVNEANERRHQP